MTYRIVIRGQVQGVGFRPFVYSAALSHRLSGTVSNNEEGVIIFASGRKEDLAGFYRHLVTSPPEVARVKSHSAEEIEEREFESFSIVPSEKNARLNLQLTPDFALCKTCEKDLADPANRRYAYPFTTCTYCGPRWAITNSFPFERDHTNMRAFPMCPSCQKEYEDPLDRRFHSQTNSCNKCGVKLNLVEQNGQLVETDPEKMFKEIHRLILEGNIIAIKNTSGYLLCCDARNHEAIKELRNRKRRPTKPLAILYPSLSSLKADLPLLPDQEEELTGPERPIVLIDSEDYRGPLALDALAPGLRQLGVMLPYTALLAMLMHEVPFPLVATSGNIHGSPIISTEEEASEALQEVADFFLHHNLQVTNPQDDSVVKYSSKTGQKILFRRSRGYAPNYYGCMPECSKKVMALGAHLKSTIAFYPNDFLYLSQYLGNLDHLDVYSRFTRTAEFFTELFEEIPEVVLCDLHPGYGSTQFARSKAQTWKAEVVDIQHHKAHFAAVLGEHELFDTEEPVLGVVWDGTGYGEDGAVWGGEFFRYEKDRMERIAHFEYFPWLAGDKMALEPRLSLFSLARGQEIANSRSHFSPEELRIYQKLMGRADLQTSSVGRIFDAVASLLGVCHFNTYEGEAAILLENRISGYDLNSCRAYIGVGEDNRIPSHKLIDNIGTDLQKGTPADQIIRNFLFTLARLIFEMAERNGFKHIACSGGVFQNATLVDMIGEIAKDNYKLYFNTALSPNDENIAFGQMAYYINLIGES